MSNRKEGKQQTFSEDLPAHEEIQEPRNVDESVDNYERNSSIYSLGREIDEYLTRTERESSGYRIYPGVEMMDYDFTAERHNMYSTNLVESSAHIIKGCLGAGILSMHEGFMFGGLWTSLVATIIIGFLVAYSMYMIAKSAQIMYLKLRVSKLSYPDLAEVSVASAPWKPIRKCSRIFRYIVDLSLFLEMCGTCCIYQIMISNTFKQVFEGTFPEVKGTITDRLYILIITVPLVLLCMIRNLKFLAPFSMMADVFVAICVLMMLYYSLREASSISERPGWKDFHGFIRFCGICLYSVDGVAICLPVENNMRRPKYFPMVLQVAMSVVTGLTAMAGFFGYWGWGEDCRSPVTVHMPINTFTLILQFLLSAMLCVTFAIQFWVAFRIVWYYVGKRYTRKRGHWERIYRLIHVIIITCVAVAFPNLIKVIGFIGNFFLGFIAFAFPAVIETLVTWADHPIGRIRWKFLKNIVMASMGLALSGCAIVYSARD